MKSGTGVGLSRFGVQQFTDKRFQIPQCSPCFLLRTQKASFCQLSCSARPHFTPVWWHAAKTGGQSIRPWPTGTRTSLPSGGNKESLKWQISTRPLYRFNRATGSCPARTAWYTHSVRPTSCGSSSMILSTALMLSTGWKLYHSGWKVSEIP